MSEPPVWLPDLILLDAYTGSWERYENEVYAIFYRDFVESSPQFKGRHVRITKQLIEGKERAFWHCIQEGPIEAERTPDIRRCERIGWIRPMVEHTGDPMMKQWSNQRGRHVRQLLWLEQSDYLVVLEDRRTLDALDRLLHNVGTHQAKAAEGI